MTQLAEGVRYPLAVRDWLQALCVQGGLVVEGDESEEELSEAIDNLIETLARRAS